jgi:hypothetical protein
MTYHIVRFVVKKDILLLTIITILTFFFKNGCNVLILLLWLLKSIILMNNMFNTWIVEQILISILMQQIKPTNNPKRVKILSKLAMIRTNKHHKMIH